jgi:hypothetical protein
VQSSETDAAIVEPDLRSRAETVLAWLRHPVPWLVLIAGITVAGGITYVLKVKGYFVMPDELTYQREALYIAQHGRPVPPSDVYYTTVSQLPPLLMAPVWAVIGPIADAFDAAHVANVVIFASSCVPVFLLARRMTVGAPAALVAAAASVAVPWFALTGTMMTEPIAYPAFCWSVLGLQRAVAEPGVRGDVIGLLAVGLAIFARSQLAVLAPVLVLAVALRELVAARAEGARAVVSRHPVLLATIALLILYMIATGKSVSDLFGNYGIATEGDLLPAGTLGYSRELLTSLGLACAGVTLPLATGWAIGALGKPSHAQLFAGALVLLLAGAGLVIVSAAFSLRFSPAQNDRYVAYIAPLLFTGTAAALTVGPLRVVPAVIAGAATVWLYWTSTLAVQGLNLASPGAAFRTVIDGRSRMLADHFGVENAKPTAVVAILVGLLLVAVLVAMRRAPQIVVAAVVGVGVLGYGVAETSYTLHKIAQTQLGASPGFIASRGWADRALPSGQRLNALIGFFGDPRITTGVWWDAVFYNRKVERVYELEGTPVYEQPSHDTATVDSQTGVIHGLPGGYLLVPTTPVHVGLRGTRTLAAAGPVQLVESPPIPQAAFSLDTANGDGVIPAGGSARLRVFGEARPQRRRIALTVAAHGGPLAVTIRGARGRRLVSRTLAAEAPTTLRIAIDVPARAAASVGVRVEPPRRNAVKGALLQVSGVTLADVA